ncbi:MAG TPA: hypothetical protein VFP98_02840 [Candidatus Polarisedimenticolia bacterium]|nr:hypothetical protein [Candidatus Polarisedimenticolia bacterium]
MSRSRSAALAAVALPFLMSSTTLFAQAVVSDFSSDPAAPHGKDPVFLLRGPGAARFVYDPDSGPRFGGDARGSLSVLYDSVEPTSRLHTTVPGGLSQDDDFVFGAVMTIRADGFEPDPFGFHPIAFSLFNASTTGDDRTGDLNDFRSDTYDTLELAYFPNVSPFFGGPFLSPSVFGERIDQDAFLHFAFGSIPFEMIPGVTYLVELRHSALARTLTATLSRVRPDGTAVELPASRVVADLSGIDGFLVDSLGISAYHDGFNVFSSSGRSLRATVDYDLLFCGKLEGGRLPSELGRALRRLKRSSRLTLQDPAGE